MVIRRRPGAASPAPSRGGYRHDQGVDLDRWGWTEHGSGCLFSARPGAVPHGGQGTGSGGGPECPRVGPWCGRVAVMVHGPTDVRTVWWSEQGVADRRFVEPGWRRLRAGCARPGPRCAVSTHPVRWRQPRTSSTQSYRDMALDDARDRRRRCLRRLRAPQRTGQRSRCAAARCHGDRPAGPGPGRPAVSVTSPTKPSRRRPGQRFRSSSTMTALSAGWTTVNTGSPNSCGSGCCVEPASQPGCAASRWRSWAGRPASPPITCSARSTGTPAAPLLRPPFPAGRHWPPCRPSHPGRPPSRTVLLGGPVRAAVSTTVTDPELREAARQATVLGNVAHSPDR